MITEYATDIAAQVGIMLSKVTLQKGRSLGSLDAHLLSLEAGGRLVSEFIHQTDLDNLQNGSGCEWLDMKIRAALSRLQVLLAP